MSDDDFLYDTKIDLTNCEREPIHVPGSVQPHGVLLVLADDGAVVQLSTNTLGVVGLAHGALLGRPLAALFDDDSVARLEAALPVLSEEHVLLEVRTRPELGARPFSAIVHRFLDATILELEAPEGNDVHAVAAVHTALQSALARLQRTRAVKGLCEVAAAEVRALTGFDRVMVYRFDEDAHGEVVAEARREDLESFLGLHYPSSDIPPQARALYKRNWIRLIPDAHYVTVPLEPQRRADTGARLDLTHSVLRSVSPMHCEYLTNMGVRASMSVSLMHEQHLWGLIACHHYAPRKVSFALRRAGEFLGRMLSWQVAERERTEAAEQESATQKRQAELVARLSTGTEWLAPLTGTPQVAELTGATGFAVVFDDRVVTQGLTPSSEQLRELVLWLAAEHSDNVVAISSLSRAWPPGAAMAGVASGLLAATLSRTKREYLLWFRPEEPQVVRWAGDPRTKGAMVDGAARLSPRGSYALWQETRTGVARPWQPWELGAAAGLRATILHSVLTRVDELVEINDRLRLADRLKDEFLGLASHELRTPLNAIRGWASLLRGGSLDGPTAARAAEVIERNATAQAALIDDLLDVSRIVSGKLRLKVAEVEPIVSVSAAIETVTPAALARQITIKSVLDPNAGPISADSDRIQQIVWNLLANAVKFSPKGSTVLVTLERSHSSVLLTVQDHGAGIPAEFLPHLFDRFRQLDAGSARKHGGLGLGLSIVRHLVELHGGTVEARSEGLGHGATFRVLLPVSAVRASAAERASMPAISSASFVPPVSLQGMRVLVVDDEPDARALLQTLLTQCGAEVRTAQSASEALELLQQELPHMIISDIGMPDMDGYSLMRAVRALPPEAGGRVPSIALTAFARPDERAQAFRAGFKAHVPKPVDPQELLAVVASFR